MRKPWYQKIVKSYIPWIITGFLFVGSLLDTVSNAIDLITPSVTYIGTILTIVLFSTVKFSLSKYPIRWVTEDNQLVHIRKPGIVPILALSGVLTALWLPRLFNWSNGIPSASLSEKSSFNTTKEVFPEFLGYYWTYNFSQISESSGEEMEQYQTGQVTRRIAGIETGINDYARVIAVDQSGIGFFGDCPTTLNSGGLDIWYVVDDTRFYTACTKEEAYMIANDIRFEDQNGSTPGLLTPDYIVPFEVGNLWTWDTSIPPRDDPNYQWHVQAKVDVIVPAGQFQECFRIVLGTAGDTMIKWICPGVGLVAFEYHHRGAVNDYRAELISYGLSEPDNSTK